MSSLACRVDGKPTSLPPHAPTDPASSHQPSPAPSRPPSVASVLEDRTVTPQLKTVDKRVASVLEDRTVTPQLQTVDKRAWEATQPTSPLKSPLQPEKNKEKEGQEEEERVGGLLKGQATARSVTEVALLK